MAESAGNSSGNGGHNAQGGGRSSGGPSNPANAAAFALRKLLNERQMQIYAASLCGLLAIFILFHWTRWLVTQHERSSESGQGSGLGKPFARASRLVRNVLVRKVPGFKSAGHAFLVTAYLAINLAVTFTNLDTSSMSTCASRFAWMALGNLIFAVFLALKNTPLAFLTAYSYERLNCLHHIVGYTVFTYIVLHASLYTAYFANMGRLMPKYSDRNMIAGIIAGFALLSTVLAATALRRVWYEVFYVVHIASYITLVVGIGFHQPDFGKGLILTLIAAALWFSDRLIRASRLALNSVNNEAAIYPLPNGGTKIVMKKVPALAQSGKHCFLWIPAIRKFETHPFTIHKTDPVEFTVKANNGFTRDLHKYAVANPGAKVRASLDGPYGTFPDPMEYDKIVLIAGGGGATFTFGLAVNVLERMKNEAHKNIVFIWAVRQHENLSWFKEQLDFLKTHAHSPKIDISLYVTRSPGSSPDLRGDAASTSSGGPSPPLSPTVEDIEKGGAPQLPLTSHQPPISEKDTEKEILETHVEHRSENQEKNSVVVTSSMSHSNEHPVKAGRPDLVSVIRDAITTTPSNQRVLVAACGPDGLMHLVRDNTARLIRGDGPGVELHCEQFGW